MEGRGVLTLEVGRTWDGAAIGADEIARLGLALHRTALHLEVDAPYHGDPPPPGPPGPTPHLWEHEVVELFVAGPALSDGTVPYTEIELSPHGHHLVLRLQGIRRVVARELPLDFAPCLEGARWRGHARLDLGLLPRRPWRMNAYAMHGTGAARRHLAWAPVPGRTPDFHRLHCFLRVDL